MKLGLKDMTVCGRTVTAKSLKAAVRRMKRKPFACKEIAEVVLSSIEKEASIPKKFRNKVADRCADRLIQRLRKSGHISLGSDPGSRRVWTWGGEQ